MATNKEILFKFINDQSQKVQSDISQQGYKRNSPYVDRQQNIIQGQPGQPTPITMRGVDKTLLGTDEYGNQQIMHPGQEYEFPGSQVTETQYAKYGGLLNKTIKCGNCGWSWKAADGGNDVNTCHKCNEEVLIQAQVGGESQESVEWTKKYVSSPKYRERITNSGYDNPDKQINKRLQNLENVNIVDTNNPQGTVYKPSRNTIETSYPADLEYYNIHKNLYPTRPNLDSIVAHELGHSETNRQNSTASLLNKYDRGQLKDRLVPEAYDDLQVYIDNYLKHDKSHHNVIPEENKSDLNSYRYDMRNQYDAGTQDFTKEHLQNSPSSFAKERLLKNYSDEDLIWLMNNVAQNNNDVQIPTAQLGGGRFLPKDERDNSRASVDNTRVNNFNDARLFSKTARNKTDKEIINERNKRIDASIVANKKGNLFTDNNWRQQLADRTQATGDKFRIFPNDAHSAIDDYLNPGVFIGNMASGLGSAPLRAQQEDSYMPYVTSVAEPIVMGAVGELAAPYINKAGKVVKKALGTEEGLLSKAYKYNPYAERLNNPNKSYRVAGLNALEDFNNTGILRSQRALPENATFLDRVQARPTSFPSFQKGYADMAYANPEGAVIFETELPTFKRGDINPVTGNKIKGRHYAHRVINPETGNPVSKISGSNIKVFGDKPHWLKGYSELDLPGRNYFEGPLPIIPRNNMTQSSFDNAALQKELEPYISRVGEPSISREEEVFRNVMGNEYRSAKELENTKFFDQQGNVIPAPDNTFTPFIKDKYQIGGTVAEQYTQLTGKPWRTAHDEGLTDGTAQQNIALIERLKQQRQPLQVPIAQEQIENTQEPVQQVRQDEDKKHRQDLAKRVVEIAEDRIRNKKYIEVPDELVKSARALNESANSCIGGVCDVFKEAGAMDKVDWSNTSFAKHAKEYGFTANNGWGIKSIVNLEPGDMLQRNSNLNKEGNYYPGHSQIYLGKDANGKLRFFDNANKEERSYFEDDIKRLLDPARKTTEPSASIYKVNPYSNENPYGLTPEEQIRAVEKSKFVKSEASSPASYNWKIADNAKNYNENTKVVMDKFIDFANNNDKINELVKKTGKSKEEINDSLLNVFGELGQENQWTTSTGKGLGSRLENVGESILTAFGGGKNLSVGPGQIKFNQIPADVRKQFGINSPNDLYDVEKVLPLMTALDLKDKQVLTNWGKDNTLSSKLFGFKRDEYQDANGNVISGGFNADQLSSETDDSRLNNTVGRYSPYLRNQYSSVANNTITTGQNDWIPFNENTQQNYVPARLNTYNEDSMTEQYARDPGSYPYKVESNWRNNLERSMITNDEGAIELPEMVLPKRKLRKEMGGLLYNDKNTGIPHDQSVNKYLAPEQTLINFMTKMQKENGGVIPFGDYYKANIINSRNKS